MSFNFEISNNAFQRVLQIRKQELNNNLVLQVSVLGGGCSGFQYKFELVENYPENAFVFELDDSKIVVDKESALFLNNSKLDFVEDLGSASFQIANPNSTAKCGCGNSFAI